MRQPRLLKGKWTNPHDEKVNINVSENLKDTNNLYQLHTLSREYYNLYS